MRRKIKVLLHSMTFKRDFGFVYCLSKVLEHLGCDALVCSNTDYTSMPMRLWNPDVVFYVTMGRTELLRKTFPNASLVLWNAESCRFGDYPPLELEIASDKSKYQSLSRILLWGDETKKLILHHAREHGWDWITGDLGVFDSKCVVVGHPRLDLVRYGAGKRSFGKDKINIGIIGFFSGVNHGKFTIPEMLLNDRETDDNFMISKDFFFQLKYLQLIKKMQFDFPVERYRYSLRPYFLENIHGYSPAYLVKSGKLSIDDSIEFTSWMQKQDLIIGAISTTIYLVAAAGMPYINVDHLLGRPVERVYYAEKFLSGIPRNCPRTYEEFAQIVQNLGDFPLTFGSSGLLSEIYEKNLSSRQNLPSLFLMARQIFQAAQECGHANGLPTSLCLPLSAMRTAYAEFRGLASKANDYSHFRKDALGKADDEFSGVIKNILAAIPPEELESIT